MEEQKPLESGEARVIDLTDSTIRKDLPFYKAFSLAFKDKQGKVWEGTFLIKRMTVGDLSRLGVRIAQLDGGLTNVPDAIASINRMVAHCEVALVEKPSWFKPEDMYDQALLIAVYAEVSKFEESFR